MDCTVRLITPDDASQVFRNLFVKNNLDSVAKQLEKDVEKMESGEFIRCVADCEGAVVGQVEFAIPESPIKKHIVEMGGMVVMGNYQGKGISSKLLWYGVKWAKSKGVKMIILSVRKETKAEEIYKHWGFEVYGELKRGIVEPWDDGSTYNEVLMSKEI